MPETYRAHTWHSGHATARARYAKYVPRMRFYDGVTRPTQTPFAAKSSIHEKEIEPTHRECGGPASGRGDSSRRTVYDVRAESAMAAVWPTGAA